MKRLRFSNILKATKTGYSLWEDDLVIEQGETVTVLVEMEKE